MRASLYRQVSRPVKRSLFSIPCSRVGFLPGTRSITPTPSSHTSTVIPTVSAIRMASSSNGSREIKFSEGEKDVSALQSEIDALLEQGWALDEEQMGVKKTFYFKSYFKAVTFLNMVASESAAKKHHPTMTVRIGSVDIHWTTHHPRGLSRKDLEMARHCEEGSELMGAVVKDDGKKCK